jgi:hypothetical protein
MNRRDAMTGTLGSLIAATLWPRRAQSMIFPRGAVSSTASTHDLILNVGQLSYFDTQQMFLNVLKQAGSNSPVYSAWSTWNSGGSDTGEEAYLEQILDSNGYPTTLTLPTPPSGGQLFTKLAGAVFVSIGTGPGAATVYPADTYRFQWQGKVTIAFSGDVKVLANASAGCTISGLQVTSTNAWGTTNSVTLQGTGGAAISPTTAGIRFTVTAIPDSANYPKAMTCVQSTYTSQFDGGATFHPNFLAFLQQVPWKALRFMDTLNTNNQVQHARYVGYMFSSAPTAGTALPALSAAWPNQSGQRRVTLATGEELQVTFTTGSTAVTSTTNPTITATTSTVPAGELTTDFFWFEYDSWASRSQVADMTYATIKGIPYEICISLCNLLNCSAWLNIPPQLQSSDWASLCSLVTSNVTSGKKTFIEWGNEVWNQGTFTVGHWANCKSFKLWGTTDGSYYGMTISLIADQLATTAGNPGFDNAFICVVAGQAASTGVLTAQLTAPSWVAQGNTAPWQRTSASGQKTIKGVAIAPYIAGGPIYGADFTNMQAQGDGGYSDFFGTFTQNPSAGGYTYHQSNGTALPSGGWYAIASGYVTSTVTAMASYGSLPIYGYEGGWQFYHTSESPSQETFLITAARDARMAALSQLYYRSIVAAGCVPAQYNACYPYAADQWGLFETSMQPSSPLASTPARWQGAVAYVQNG